ncbi:MAG TPA: UbiD family decarboxylase [Cellulomonas sp.]
MSTDQSFAGYVRSLEDAGQLVTIPGRVGLRSELASCLSLLEDGPAVRFLDVEGSWLPVIGNLLASRERMAGALGVGVEDLAGRLVEAVRAPIAPVEVTDAPCQEVVTDADLTRLPVPSFFSRETGPYLSAGVIFARDPVTGVRNASYARFKVLDATHAMLGVSPAHHLGRMVAKAAEIGVELPISVAIGNHPAVMLAACLYLGYGDDEAECAGALLGEPLEMVASTESAIRVPAGSEMILEGTVDPSGRIAEGPVSEFTGVYHEYGSGYVVTFTRLTRRDDPYFQVILPGLHAEHCLLGGVPIAAGLEQMLRRIAPNVAGVAVPVTGAGRTSAVVALHEPRPGQARQVIAACWSQVPLVKQVVVVDDDVDPWNPVSVEWARMTRVHPERDLLIAPGMRTDRSEPLQRENVVDKLGVDATKAPGDRAEGWELARLPSDGVAAARRTLAAAGIEPRVSPLLAGIRALWA